jgi:hypothetical protein
MWLLNVFLGSLVLTLFLLVTKIQEIKNSRQSSVSRFITKGDPFIRSIVKYFQGFWNHYRDRAFFVFLVHVPNRIEEFFKNLRHKSHGYYHGANTKIRGKRELMNRPDSAVSPYMRSMSMMRDADKGQVS